MIWRSCCGRSSDVGGVMVPVEDGFKPEIEARFVDRVEDLPDDRAAPLLTYWLRLAEVHPIPRHKDFDVLQLPSQIWPSLILAQAEDGGADFLYRIAGTEIDANNGFVAQGKRLSDMNLDSDGRLGGEFREALKAGKPRTSWGRFLRGDWNFKNVIRLVCPLADDDGVASYIVGVVLFYSQDEFHRRTRSDELRRRPWEV